MVSNSLIGFGRNIRGDAIFAMLIGSAFIGMQFLSDLFSLAVPPVAASLTPLGTFLIVVIVAPFVEELLFRGFLLKFLAKRLNDLFAIVIQAVLFSIFHYSVYGTFGGLTTAFIGAGGFGVLAGALALQRNSLVAPIIIHMMVNFWAIKSLLFG